MRAYGTFFTLPNALVDCLGKTMTPGALRVMLSIARHMNEVTGDCHPSYALIEREWTISRDSVARGIRELEALGIITVRREGQRNHYQFSHLTSQTTKLVPTSDQSDEKTSTSQMRKPALVFSSDANKTKLTRRSNKTNGDTPYSPPFELFWDRWPSGARKVNKGGAYAVWRGKGLDEKAAAVMEGLEQWIVSADWAKNDGEFIPLVVTWLNQDRYYAKPRRATATNGHKPQTFGAAVQEGNDRASAEFLAMFGEETDGQTEIRRGDQPAGGGLPGGNPQSDTRRLLARIPKNTG